MSAQDDANQAAKEFACNSAAQLALLANPDATELVIDGVPVFPPNLIPPYVSPPGTKIFYNSPQTCSVTCPDASLFTFTCPPGRFMGANQAQADAIAKSYACQQAFLRRVCPPSHPCSITDASPLPAFDQGQPYSHQFTASGGVPPFAWSIVAGTLPAGLSMNANGLISGTASLVNGNLDQTFTVRATDFSTPPNSCTKEFTLPVVDYHAFPPGKHFRINGFPSTINWNCGDVLISGFFWDGKFNSTVLSAWFSTTTGGGSVAMDAGGGIITGWIPFLRAGQDNGPEWFIIIINDIPLGRCAWAGRKIGSNAGAKLDSPAGVYAIDVAQAALEGYTFCSNAPATLTIEEY